MLLFLVFEKSIKQGNGGFSRTWPEAANLQFAGGYWIGQPGEGKPMSFVLSVILNVILFSLSGFFLFRLIVLKKDNMGLERMAESNFRGRIEYKTVAKGLAWEFLGEFSGNNPFLKFERLEGVTYRECEEPPSPRIPVEAWRLLTPEGEEIPRRLIKDPKDGRYRLYHYLGAIELAED